MKTIAIETVEVPSTVDEAYRLVRNHFAKPDAVLGKSECGTKCQYKTQTNGAKCAVGCLVPDDLYTRDMEGRNWGNLIEWADNGGSEYPKLSAFILGLADTPEVARFLAIAQKLHDICASDAADFIRLLDAAYLSFLIPDDDAINLEVERRGREGADYGPIYIVG